MWYWIISSWNMKGEGKTDPASLLPQKNYLQGLALSRLNWIYCTANVTWRMCWHIARLTIRLHIFLELWLVDTWLFADTRPRRAVTLLENVVQSTLRRGKKPDFNCHINIHTHTHGARNMVTERKPSWTGRRVNFHIFLTRASKLARCFRKNTT